MTKRKVNSKLVEIGVESPIVYVMSATFYLFIRLVVAWRFAFWKAIDEKLDAFLLRSRTRKGYPFLPLLFNILEVLAKEVREEKEIKGIQIGKEKIQWSICRWHDCLCRKSQRINLENLLELIIIERLHKTRLIYRSHLLSCKSAMNNWDLKLKLQYHYVSTKRRNTDINLTKWVRHQTRKTTKFPWKKIKDLNEWRDIPCPWIGILYMIMIELFLTWSVNPTQSQSKPSKLFWVLIDKLILKFIWKGKDPEKWTQFWRRTNSEDWHSPTSRHFIKLH